MSSRNLRLNIPKKEKEPWPFPVTYFIKEHLRRDRWEVKQQALKMLEAEGFKVDYVE